MVVMKIVDVPSNAHESSIQVASLADLLNYYLREKILRCPHLVTEIQGQCLNDVESHTHAAPHRLSFHLPSPPPAKLA